MEPVAVASYKIENLRCIGIESDNTTVYEVNSFDGKDAVVDNTPSEALLPPVVCTWEDNKTAAVSITIDDGNYASAVKYNNLQKIYGIHSTQFVIAGKLKDVDGWKAIFADGYMDLGNHSEAHEKEVWQSLSTCTDAQLAGAITGPQSKLKSTFPGQDVFTFAAPWGQTSEAAINEMKKGHYANRLAGGGVLQSKTPSDFFKIPCYAVQYGTELSKLNGYVDTAISSGGWFVPLLHAIGSSGSSATEYSSNYDTIENHFKYIKQQSDAGKIWSGSFNDVVKYIYERNSAKAKILWSTASSVGIKVTDGMSDDELFDYPLTFRVNLPASWSGKVKVT